MELITFNKKLVLRSLLMIHKTMAMAEFHSVGMKTI